MMGALIVSTPSITVTQTPQPIKNLKEKFVTRLMPNLIKRLMPDLISTPTIYEVLTSRPVRNLKGEIHQISIDAKYDFIRGGDGGVLTVSTPSLSVGHSSID